MAKTLDATEAPAPRSKKKKKKLLIGVAVLVLAVAGVGFKVLRPASAEEGDKPPAEGAIVTVDEQMTVNLAGPELHYGRVGFALVLADSTPVELVQPRLPLVKDAVISVVGTYSPEQLRTPTGVQQLRKQLSQRARQLYPDGEILRVVLTELIVQ